MNLICGSSLKLKDLIKHDILGCVCVCVCVCMGAHMPTWSRCKFVGDQIDFSDSGMRFEMENDWIYLYPAIFSKR